MAVRHASRRAGIVAAITVVLMLVLSGPASAQSRDRTPPTAPTNLRVTALTQTSVTLAWNASTDNSGKFSYVVSKDGQGFTVPQTQTTYTIDWLSPGRTYRFSVAAVDKSLNRSASSNTVTVTTPADTTPPSAPTLTASALSPSQVSLIWTKSIDDLSPFVGYAVLLNGAVATSHVNWWNERSVVLRHLAPGASYTFSIRARDSAGNTATSNAVTVTMPASGDTTAPSAPGNLRLLFDQGCAEVWLGFDQSTDDQDPQSAIEYEVYVNGVLSPLPVRAGIGEEFVYGTVDGWNTFVVKAVDRAGNTSAASNEISAFLWTC